jgi:hypothetical protein
MNYDSTVIVKFYLLICILFSLHLSFSLPFFYGWQSHPAKREPSVLFRAHRHAGSTSVEPEQKGEKKAQKRRKKAQKKAKKKRMGFKYRVILIFITPLFFSGWQSQPVKREQKERSVRGL